MRAFCSSEIKKYKKYFTVNLSPLSLPETLGKHSASNDSLKKNTKRRETYVKSLLLLKCLNLTLSYLFSKAYHPRCILI